MRRVLTALAALTIFLPAAVSAQGVRERQEEAGRNAPAPQAGPREGGRANAEQAAPRPQAAQGQGRRGPNAAQNGPQPNVAQEPDRRGRSNSQLAPRQGAPARNFAENRDRGRDDNRGGDFRNDNRGRDFRGDRDRGGRVFNFRGRQYAAMRAPAYRYPRGWGYRHWGRGEFLPSVFLSSAFYFDYDWLGLPPPPPGARWVRNGPDALLVSVYDGRILDVIYDAFY
jgi:Ni/Co efflux regulator RcnB